MKKVIERITITELRFVQVISAILGDDEIDAPHSTPSVPDIDEYLSTTDEETEQEEVLNSFQSL